jgi:hypothetical protein
MDRLMARRLMAARLMAARLMARWRMVMEGPHVTPVAATSFVTMTMDLTVALTAAVTSLVLPIELTPRGHCMAQTHRISMRVCERLLLVV